ncbi:MAG: hypothetical protein AAGK00_06080 [Pseudomonadota bacterium]
MSPVAYIVRASMLSRATAWVQLLGGAVVGVWIVLGVEFPGFDGDLQGRSATVGYFVLSALVLIALPLGFAGVVGDRRRAGLALRADAYELHFGVGGRWQGPLAWHRVANLRLDQGWLGSRIGVDLLEPESVIQDFGRPLSMLEEYRMKKGGPALTIPGRWLANSVEDVHAALVKIWQAAQ